MRFSFLDLGQSLILEKKKTIYFFNITDIENTEKLFIDRNTSPEGHKSSKTKNEKK